MMNKPIDLFKEITINVEDLQTDDYYNGKRVILVDLSGVSTVTVDYEDYEPKAYFRGAKMLIKRKESNDE